jgi:hypothetical protein
MKLTMEFYSKISIFLFFLSNPKKQQKSKFHLKANNNVFKLFEKYFSMLLF